MNHDFSKLEETLEAEEWPSVYLFKFIAPSDNHKIALVSNSFDDAAEINMRQSSNGKYTSISVQQMMLDAKSVVEIYQKVAQIEGVIIL